MFIEYVYINVYISIFLNVRSRFFLSEILYSQQIHNKLAHKETKMQLVHRDVKGNALNWSFNGVLCGRCCAFFTFYCFLTVNV